MYEGALQDLVDELGRLPGVGPKSAQRIAFHILAADPVAPGSWFAAGTRLLKSADDGKTWTVAFTPSDAEERITGFHRAEDGTVRLLLERERVVVTSKGNAWETCTAVGASDRTSRCVALAVDPNDPKHLLVAARTLAHQYTPKDEEGGPYESFDEGKTWKRIAEGLILGKDERVRGRHQHLLGSGYRSG